MASPWFCATAHRVRHWPPTVSCRSAFPPFVLLPFSTATPHLFYQRLILGGLTVVLCNGAPRSPLACYCASLSCLPFLCSVAPRINKFHPLTLSNRRQVDITSICIYLSGWCLYFHHLSHCPPSFFLQLLSSWSDFPESHII